VARRINPPTAAPTPMPTLAPKLSPEPVPPPSGVVLLLPATVLPGIEVVVSAIDDVITLLLDVKTVTEALPASVEATSVEVGPDVAVAELGALEELSSALVEPELCVGLVNTDAGGEVGIWPTKNWMLCPVLWGSEQMFVRLVESLNATVADDAKVQLQYEPGWRVEGFPSCEQMAHSPLLLSQSVRATHGWSISFTGQLASLYSGSLHPAQYVR